MAKLIYSLLCSLDGYIEDPDGNFDWAMPDNEVFEFINDMERSIGTYLYGRRMYDMMTGWETDPSLAAASPIMGDFAQIWQAAEKVVYSKTLEAASTSRTRIEREFDPAAVQRLKDEAESDLNIAGPDLAAHAFKAGLVDECRLFFSPVIVGGGKPVLPRGVRLDLELVGERDFGNGMVYVAYRAKR